MRQIEKIAVAILIVITAMFISLVILSTVKDDSNVNKPISYPEEIQIAKAGDTLIVSSVSDSIYIGFKNK